jgi:signal transduction histidine kinase
LASLPTAASALAISIGALVLIGWSLDLEALKRVLPGFVAMNPATAVLFILSGISLAISIRRKSPDLRVIRKLFAAIVIAASLAELLQLAGVWHSIVDEILFSSRLSTARDALPNRMAPNTTLNFFLTGLSLFTLDTRGKQSSLSQALAIVVGFGALLPITGYAYGVQSFSGLATFIPMAIHTATTFLILAAGLFFAVPDAPLAQVFATNDSRGIMARRFFPLAVLVTLVLGWLRTWGERHELYESAFGTALFAIMLTIIFALLVRWTVTTVGKLEAERATMVTRLHDVNRRKDEMIAVVSHDLCSPLTGFRLVIDMLRQDDGKDTTELLDLMDHSTRRMVSMVRGLLDATKLQSEVVELELEEVLVSDVIRLSIEPLVINANAKHITLQFHSALNEPVLHADRLRLSQIFNNLLSNAVKFTSAGGQVDVILEAFANGVRVSVSDTGLGIPKNDLPHIFDKYYQASSKATGGEPGTGLGLAIVRESVLLHGGRIDVTSETNRGTTFTVYLPANAAEKQGSVSLAANVLPFDQRLVAALSDPDPLRRSATSFSTS